MVDLRRPLLSSTRLFGTNLLSQLVDTLHCFEPKLAYRREARIYHILLFTLHGSLAKAMVDLLEEEQPESDAYNTALKDFLFLYYSRLPNPSCTPHSLYTTSWQKDRFAGYGSYTNFQTLNSLSEQDVNLAQDVQVLRAGLPNMWLPL